MLSISCTEYVPFVSSRLKLPQSNHYTEANQENTMRLRRNQLCPIHRPTLLRKRGNPKRKSASAGWAFGASKILIIPGDTGNSDPTVKCGSYSTGRSLHRMASALSARKRSATMATSCPTISIPEEWEGHGETIIRITFRRSIGGAMGKRDRAEGDLWPVRHISLAP